MFPEYLSIVLKNNFSFFDKYAELCNKKDCGFNKIYFLNGIRNIKKNLEECSDKQLYKIRLNEIKASYLGLRDNTDIKRIKIKLKEKNSTNRVLFENYKLYSHNIAPICDYVDIIDDHQIFLLLKGSQSKNTLCTEIETEHLNLGEENTKLLIKVKKTLVANKIPEKMDVLILNKAILIAYFENGDQGGLAYDQWLTQNIKNKALNTIDEIEKIINNQNNDEFH